jgi:hypothetical protein
MTIMLIIGGVAAYLAIVVLTGKSIKHGLS